MRVISGSLKGRIIKNNYIKTTRATMQSIKESVFSMLDLYIDESIFLDLFSGTGQIGIEAYSRGAKEVYLVDYNKTVIKHLQELKTSFKLDSINIIQSDYKKYLETTNKTYDIIYIDPPYDKYIVNDTIDLIIKNNLLNKDGLIVCEMESNIEISINDKVKIINHKKYNKKEIIIYKKK